MVVRCSFFGPDRGRIPGEATRAIRGLSGNAGIVPIIAMAANVFPDDIKVCRDAGMNDFLPKPLDINQLEDVLTRWAFGAAGS